jgi:cobalt-zinc-cadmium efflux system protein
MTARRRDEREAPDGRDAAPQADCAPVRHRASAPRGHEHAHGAHDHAHEHEHGHAHGHGHHHGHGASVRRLRLVLVLTATFLVAEVVGGIVSNSLALLADAGHMLTDVAALALSLFVAWFSRQPGTPEKTYGYLRWEILAAFLNGATLLIVSGWIMWEAVSRFRAPEPVRDGLMLAVASGGLAINVVCAWLLRPAADTNLNMRGAYLHVVGDLLGSVATVIAALVVRQTGWLLADPIASVLMTLLIMRSAWRLTRESVDVLLESTPAHIPLGRVRERLETVPGVVGVHDLHVWTVTSGLVAMSAHAVVPDMTGAQDVLERMHAAMREMGIEHVTVQLEQRRMYECERHLHA